MKKVEIPLPNKERLMLVECPEDAYDFSISDQNGLWFRIMPNSAKRYHSICPIRLEDGGVVLGCFVPSSRSIDFEEKVNPEWNPAWNKFHIDWLTESLLSLLQAETEKVFPIDDNPYEKGMRGYDEAESKVMPRKFVVILIKNGG